VPLVVLSTTVAPWGSSAVSISVGKFPKSNPARSRYRALDAVVDPGVGSRLLDGDTGITRVPFLTRSAILVLARNAITSAARAARSTAA